MLANNTQTKMGFDYANFFREEEETFDEYLEKQYQEFFEVIRIHLIVILMVTCLCFIANFIISKFKNLDLNSEIPSSRQDRLTYWVALKLCMFGLAIALGIGLLLPMTIISNEVLLLYPENEYHSLRWLNSELIKQLWRYTFIFSNLCFILIPFSYFFAESTGFSQSTDNFMSRMLQAFVETTLALTIISSCVLVGLSLIFPIFEPNFFQLITFWLNFPFLYSCISFAGALLLLVCIPKGIINLVILLDFYMTRPYLVNSTSEEYDLANMQEMVLRSRKAYLLRNMHKHGQSSQLNEDEDFNDLNLNQLDQKIAECEHRKKVLQQKLSLPWLRSIVEPWFLYPLAMMLLIGTTAFACAIVLVNLLGTLVSFEHTKAEPFVLGIASISKIGIVGAMIQTILIMYIWCASFVGLYTLPVFGMLRPVRGGTPFIKIMFNCMVILILSSALPLFTRTVGITNFDLFDKFGEIVWLKNYYLVLSYNCAFLVALSFCLCHSIVVKLSRECFKFVRGIFAIVRAWIGEVNEFLCFVRIQTKLYASSFWQRFCYFTRHKDNNNRHKVGTEDKVK